MQSPAFTSFTPYVTQNLSDHVFVLVTCSGNKNVFLKKRGLGLRLLLRAITRTRVSTPAYYHNVSYKYPILSTWSMGDNIKLLVEEQIL
jgi:hypothetical protein